MDFHHHPADTVRLSGDEGHELFEDSMLAHIAPEHRYAERVVDVTPDYRDAHYAQRMTKDGTAVWNGTTFAAVRIGEVEPGSMWLVESLVIETALLTDVGIAKVKLASPLALTRSLISIGAGGAEKNYGPPLFLARGEVFVVCTQTTPAASSVNVTAQVRVVFISD